MVAFGRAWQFSLAAVAGIIMPTKPTIIELDMDKLDDILRRVEAKELRVEDYETIRTVIESYVGLYFAVGDRNTTIRRLRQMLFGAKTEKTATVIGGKEDSQLPAMQGAVAAAASAQSQAEATPAAVTEADKVAETPVKGHGRNGADAYTGAEKIEVPNESLQPGDPCPQCETGTVYETNRPGVLVRLRGQAPVGALVYYLQKLRCNLCGVVFTAALPEGADGEKYDATVGSMIALLKYGNGMPFNRAEKLQENLGIPLPASTQWDIVEAQAERAEPVFEELIRQAAQGDIVHNDDTGVKILEMMGERARQAALADKVSQDSPEDSAKKPEAERTGMFTTGIVSTREGQKIALFLSGRQHAGENLEDVLVRRAAELPPPIQMSDALSRNLTWRAEDDRSQLLGPRPAAVRRGGGPLSRRVPARAGVAGGDLPQRRDRRASRIYHPRGDCAFTRPRAAPTMEELHVWLVRQFDDRLVEPNSALGGAISYLLKHWEKLTLFLRVPGAPLDNNICEQALKKAIRHRRNSLFYKTCHGAHVGDVFMSLIHTCELCGTNPFDYLTELDRHADEAGVNPQNWMPWNYRQTLEGMGHVQTPSEEARPLDGCCREAPQIAGETHQTRVD